MAAELVLRSPRLAKPHEVDALLQRAPELLEARDKYSGNTLLLAHGARLGVLNARRWTPLHVAAAHGATLSLAEILRARADAPLEVECDRGWTALHLAAERGHAECARLLTRAGAEVDAATLLHYQDRASGLQFARGATPLAIAAAAANLDVLAVLLEMDADPARALHAAADALVRRILWRAAHRARLVLILAATLSPRESSLRRAAASALYERRVWRIVAKLARPSSRT